MPSEDALEIAQTVKEKYGYVCKDVALEYKKFDKKEKGEDGKYYLSNKFKKMVHKPSNGSKQVEIDVGYERFLGPEMFFHPVSQFDLFMFLCRNLFIQTGGCHLMSASTMPSKLAQWTTGDFSTKTSCFLEDLLSSTASTKNCTS
jgi:actin-related protein